MVQNDVHLVAGAELDLLGVNFHADSMAGWPVVEVTGLDDLFAAIFVIQMMRPSMR